MAHISLFKHVLTCEMCHPWVWVCVCVCAVGWAPLCMYAIKPYLTSHINGDIRGSHTYTAHTHNVIQTNNIQIQCEFISIHMFIFFRMPHLALCNVCLQICPMFVCIFGYVRHTISGTTISTGNELYTDVWMFTFLITHHRRGVTTATISEIGMSQFSIQIKSTFPQNISMSYIGHTLGTHSNRINIREIFPFHCRIVFVAKFLSNWRGGGGQSGRGM